MAWSHKVQDTAHRLDGPNIQGLNVWAIQLCAVSCILDKV